MKKVKVTKKTNKLSNKKKKSLNKTDSVEETISENQNTHFQFCNMSFSQENGYVD